MALVFPLAQASFGDTLPVQSVEWVPLDQQEFSGLGNGEYISHDLAPQLWQGSVTLRPLLHTEARAVQAKLNAISNREAFYLANPLGWWPARDPSGVIYGGSAPKILSINANRKEVAFEGLTPGLVLSPGDFWAVDYGTPPNTRRALVQLVGGATVDEDGETGQIEVRPHLSAGITVGLDVTFARPAAKVKIAPGSVSSSFHNANRTRISFAVRQTMQAG